MSCHGQVFTLQLAAPTEMLPAFFWGGSNLSQLPQLEYSCECGSVFLSYTKSIWFLGMDPTETGQGELTVSCVSSTAGAEILN